MQKSLPKYQFSYYVDLLYEPQYQVNNLFCLWQFVAWFQIFFRVIAGLFTCWRILIRLSNSRFSHLYFLIPTNNGAIPTTARPLNTYHIFFSHPYILYLFSFVNTCSKSLKFPQKNLYQLRSRFFYNSAIIFQFIHIMKRK